MSIDLVFFIGLAVAMTTLVRESRVSSAGAGVGMILGALVATCLAAPVGVRLPLILYN